MNKSDLSTYLCTTSGPICSFCTIFLKPQRDCSKMHFATIPFRLSFFLKLDGLDFPRLNLSGRRPAHRAAESLLFRVKRRYKTANRTRPRRLFVLFRCVPDFFTHCFSPRVFVSRLNNPLTSSYTLYINLSSRKQKVLGK